jgi:hypothetical protein
MRGLAGIVGVALAASTVILAWVFIVLTLTGALEDAPQEWTVDTNCSQEDSCYPDYRNGEWYIVEGSRD